MVKIIMWCYYLNFKIQILREYAWAVNCSEEGERAGGCGLRSALCSSWISVLCSSLDDFTPSASAGDECGLC